MKKIENHWFKKYVSCYMQGWPTSQRSRATFLTVLQQRATSYTWAHMNITPSLLLSHILLL